MLQGWRWSVEGSDAVCLPIAPGDFDPPTADLDGALRDLAATMGKKVVERKRYRGVRVYFAKLAPKGKGLL